MVWLAQASRPRACHAVDSRQAPISSLQSHMTQTHSEGKTGPTSRALMSITAQGNLQIPCTVSKSHKAQDPWRRIAEENLAANMRIVTHGPYAQPATSVGVGGRDEVETRFKSQPPQPPPGLSLVAAALASPSTVSSRCYCGRRRTQKSCVWSSHSWMLSSFMVFLGSVALQFSSCFVLLSTSWDASGVAGFFSETRLLAGAASCDPPAAKTSSTTRSSVRTLPRRLIQTSSLCCEGDALVTGSKISETSCRRVCASRVCALIWLTLFESSARHYISLIMSNIIQAIDCSRSLLAQSLASLPRYTADIPEINGSSPRRGLFLNSGKLLHRCGGRAPRVMEIWVLARRRRSSNKPTKGAQQGHQSQKR